MFVQFSGKKVDLYTNTKQFVRRFNVPHDVVNAQVSGDGEHATVAITMKNGRTNLYSWTGQIIRQG